MTKSILRYWSLWVILGYLFSQFIFLPLSIEFDLNSMELHVRIFVAMLLSIVTLGGMLITLLPSIWVVILIFVVVFINWLQVKK